MIARRCPFLLIVGLAVLVSPHAGRAQVSGGATLPGGTQVGMGTVDDDPEQERERMRRRFGELIEQARALIAEQQWRQAREKLDSARNLVTDRQADGAKLRELYLKLEEHGRAMLAEADAASRQGEYEQAMATYEQIAHMLRSLPVADDARQALSTLRADPDVRAYFAEQRAAAFNRQIDLILARGDSANDRDDSAAQADESEPAPEDEPPARPERIRLLPVEEQLEIVEIMEQISEAFPATPTGEAVAVELAELLSDQALREAVEQAGLARAADQALQRARLYHNAGRLEKALACYEDVIEQYPDTPAAAIAREQAEALSIEVQVNAVGGPIE